MPVLPAVRSPSLTLQLGGLQGVIWLYRVCVCVSLALPRVLDGIRESVIEH